MSRPAELLEAHRQVLFGVAYRLLGSRADAEDVLQDAYLRWRDAPAGEIREPRRYLTRIVTRLAIDRLRDRANRDTYVGPWLPEPIPTGSSALDPFETAEQRESVATATLLLMERLDPVERTVFVLRTAFELPYAEIAEIVERTPEHCRQLYRRASGHIAADRRRFTPSRGEHAELLERFLRAARDGDLAGLQATLHHDVMAWSDGGGRVRAARNVVIGADKVSRFFAGILGRLPYEVIPVELNGSPAALMRSPGICHALGFAVAGDVISGVYLVSNPAKLAGVRPLFDRRST